MAAQWEVFNDTDGQIRWRLRAANGEIIAVSEAYTSLTAALGGIDSVRANAGADINDLTAE